MTARTPDELESLLEDAVVLRDTAAVAALFEPGGVLVAGRGSVATGRVHVECAARSLWTCGYLADPRRALHASGLALVVGARSVTVARMGNDGLWRYAFAVFRQMTEEPTMHTMVVRMSTDPTRQEDVVRHLRDDIVPWARSRPGFVRGQWLVTADGTEGSGVIVFDSAEAAERAAEGPRTYDRDDTRAWNIESVTVYGQVAAADGAVVTS